jgi:hypothetical protein
VKAVILQCENRVKRMKPTEPALLSFHLQTWHGNLVRLKRPIDHELRVAISNHHGTPVRLRKLIESALVAVGNRHGILVRLRKPIKHELVDRHTQIRHYHGILVRLRRPTEPELVVSQRPGYRVKRMRPTGSGLLEIRAQPRRLVCLAKQLKPTKPGWPEASKLTQS